MALRRSCSNSVHHNSSLRARASDCGRSMPDMFASQHTKTQRTHPNSLRAGTRSKHWSISGTGPLDNRAGNGSEASRHKLHHNLLSSACWMGHRRSPVPQSRVRGHNRGRSIHGQDLGASRHARLILARRRQSSGCILCHAGIGDVHRTVLGLLRSLESMHAKRTRRSRREIAAKWRRHGGWFPW